MSEPSKDFNFTLDVDTTAGLISKGLHLAECVDVDLSDNKAGDGKNLVLKFKILTPGESGRQITLYQSLKKTVAWKYTQTLAAFGVDTSKEQVAIKRSLFVGKRVRLQISHSDYQGSDRAQIENLLRIEDAPIASAASTAPLPPAIKAAAIPPRAAKAPVAVAAKPAVVPPEEDGAAQLEAREGNDASSDTQTDTGIPELLELPDDNNEATTGTEPKLPF